jgi:hypothetical protein
MNVPRMVSEGLRIKLRRDWRSSVATEVKAEPRRMSRTFSLICSAPPSSRRLSRRTLRGSTPARIFSSSSKSRLERSSASRSPSSLCLRVRLRARTTSLFQRDLGGASGRRQGLEQVCQAQARQTRLERNRQGHPVFLHINGQYIQTLYRRAEQHASTFCRSRGEAQDKAWSGGKAVRKDLACGWRIVNFRRGSTLQLDHARSH